VGRAGPGEPAARCCWRRRAACSRRGGAGLVVDDLQWADASSIWIPEAVLPRLVGVGAVLVYRPDELVPGNAASTFVTRARADVTVIELHPLDVNAIAELSADDDLTAVLTSATDRTPIAVTEVMRTLAAEDAITPTGDGRWRPLTRRLLDRAREVDLDGQHAAIISRAFKVQSASGGRPRSIRGASRLPWKVREAEPRRPRAR
jgi:hypothetical protein